MCDNYNCGDFKQLESKVLAWRLIMCDNYNCGDFKQLESKVLAWADDKGLLCADNSKKQLLKSMSEMGELADCEISDDYLGIIDGVGDVLVTLIIYANQKGLTLEHCLSCAWEEIKDRTGETKDGVFIKDGE